MAQPRKLQQYQRLNAFGEPFQGSQIRGVQARRYMGGPSQGALSDRRYNVREEAEKEAMRQDRAEQEAAAARGQAAAGGGASQAQQAAPKREGMLIPTAGGGSKWASGDELDRMDAMKEKARRQARKAMDMSAKNAAGVAAFGTGKPPPQTAAEAAVADRAKARARYEAEKRGNAPASATAEKKPESRKEGVMPATTHSSPVRATAPASKPEPKMVAPHLLFTDRAKPAEAPAPKTRAIDSHVSNPANRSVMTGKTRAQELAEESAAKKKRERENMFRPKYMPNKSRGF